MCVSRQVGVIIRANQTGAARVYMCRPFPGVPPLSVVFSALRALICHDDACGGHADGWGVRACAVALTVGKDLCILSIRGKYEENAACESNADG